MPVLCFDVIIFEIFLSDLKSYCPFQIYLDAGQTTIRRPLLAIAISSNKPILLARFIASDNKTAGSEPSMSIVPPVSQFLHQYSFSVSIYFITEANKTITFIPEINKLLFCCFFSSSIISLEL